MERRFRRVKGRVSCMNENVSLSDLIAIMDRLRDPDGCPWDREQTFSSLRSYLLEEAYEVADALDRQDLAALREELGDLLFQIVFLARLASERDAFDMRDVLRTIAEKMVRRHPHVFGDAVAKTSGEVLRNWEEIKRHERAAAERQAGGSSTIPSLLDGIPAALPALLKAQRLGVKAARIGFDWPLSSQVADKVAEELDELREALAGDDRRRVDEEVGDLLFAAAMLARHAGVDPEGALEAANHKFRRRFNVIEAELARHGVPPETAGQELLERLWIEAKQLEGEPPPTAQGA